LASTLIRNKLLILAKRYGLLPKHIMLTWPFIYFIICGATGIVLWLRMVNILSDKGLDPSHMFVRPKDYRNFSALVKNEKDPILKRKYKLLLRAQIFLIPAYIVGFFLLVFMELKLTW